MSRITNGLGEVCRLEKEGREEKTYRFGPPGILLQWPRRAQHRLRWRSEEAHRWWVMEWSSGRTATSSPEQEHAEAPIPWGGCGEGSDLEHLLAAAAISYLGGGERLCDEVRNEGGSGSSRTSAAAISYFHAANGSAMRSGGGSSRMSAAISYLGGGRVAPRST